jgi:excinuclease ABC subunit A
VLRGQLGRAIRADRDCRRRFRHRNTPRVAVDGRRRRKHQARHPAAAGRFDAEPAPKKASLSRAAARTDTARRVAAGGSAHAAAPDVRRTPNLSEEKRRAAQRLAQDLLARISTLQGLGLGYLAMARATPTLSPGELQRLRLATQIRSNLFGVIYVLDEPTVGLHPADGAALLRALEQLKANGNSLFVVEHDLEVMRRADWIVDVGPEGGTHGGEIVIQDVPEKVVMEKRSYTGAYLKPLLKRTKAA